MRKLCEKQGKVIRVTYGSDRWQAFSNSQRDIFVFHEIKVGKIIVIVRNEI